MQTRTNTDDRQKLFIGIGGSGVIGSHLKDFLRKIGVYYVSLSLDPNSRNNDAENQQIDLNALDPAELSKRLENLSTNYRLVGIFDILGVRNDAANAIAAFAAKKGVKVGIISSCLLYDHTGEGIVDETFPLHKQSETQHSYLNTKLEIESYWKKNTITNWVLLRTHHVLGKGSLLGCIPDHNRDRNLLSTLKLGRPLRLANSGEVMFSFIHPTDLVAATFELITSDRYSAQAVNLVHPSPVRARDYYQLICEVSGYKTASITDFEVNKDDFWSSTSKNNVFGSNLDFVKKFDFRFGIEDAIKDAVSVGENAYPSLGAHMMRRISV